MRLLLVWLVNALALFLLPWVFPWVRVDTFWAALFAALALGLINTLIRPLLFVLTLPVTVFTLGLFIFVINGLLFWWVGSFVDGFHVAGFWSAVFGAIVYSLISWTLSALIPSRKN
ncbi:MAG: phage holin family protein [Betaproteobacteria bacterium]